MIDAIINFLALKSFAFMYNLIDFRVNHIPNIAISTNAYIDRPNVL